MVRILFLGIVLLFSSCSGWVNQEVEIDLPPHEPRIVLNSLLHAGDDTIRLGITRSFGMQEGGSVTDGLRNANVQLEVNGQAVTGFQYFAGAKEYRVAHPVREGDSLRVEVDVPGYASVSSLATIPKPVELESARFGNVNYGMGGSPSREVFFKLKNEGKETRYHILKFAEQQEGSPLRTAIQLRSNIPFIAPVYPFNVAFISTGAEETEMELQVLVLEWYYSGNREDVESYLILETVEKSYYDYMTTFYYHRNNQMPDLFGGEPVPMPSNIQNGFGIFAGASSQMIRIE